MAKPKDVSVSLYDTHKGELHVWGISLRLSGSASTPAAIVRKQKQIQKLIEALDIPEE
jgi:hypothetical protein